MDSRRKANFKSTVKSSNVKKSRPPLASRIASLAFIVAVALGWAFRLELGLRRSTLLIFTGAAFVIFIISYSNGKKFRGLTVSDRHLEKNQNIIGTIEYDS